METDYRGRLAMHMRAAGISQSELARRITKLGGSTTQGHLSLILRGERDPSFVIMARIAEALGLSLDQLAGLKQSSPSDLSADEARFLEMYRELDGAQRSAIYTIMEAQLKLRS